MISISTDLLKNLLDEYDRCKGDYRKNTVVGYLGYSDSSGVSRLRKFYNDLMDKDTARILDVVEVFQLARVIVRANSSEGSESSKVFDSLKSVYGESWITALKLLYDHHAKFNIFTLQNFQKFLQQVETEGKDPANIAKSFVAIHILINSEITKAKILEIRDAVEAHRDPINLAKALSKLADKKFGYFTDENIQELINSHDPMKTYSEIIISELTHGYSYDPDETSIGSFFSSLYRINYSEMFKIANRNNDPLVQEQLQQEQEEKRSYQWF